MNDQFRYDRVLTMGLNHGMIRTELLKGELPSGRGRQTTIFLRGKNRVCIRVTENY